MVEKLVESLELLIIKSHQLDPTQGTFNHYGSLKDWYKSTLYAKLSPFTHRRLAKRGLVNGLGTIIKFVTGNADAYDVEYFDKAIERLKSNQNTFIKQGKESFSSNRHFNRQLARKIQSLRDNQVAISQKINQMLNSTQANVDHLKTQMQETVDLLQVLHNSISEIEISFSFCKANILHPSIIPKRDLDTSLITLRGNFPDERIPPIESNYYDTLSTTSCLIHEDIILFGVEIPLFSPLEYQYKYLAAVPILARDTYGLIAIDTKYSLLTNETVLGLPSKCTPLDNKFYCKLSFKPIYLDCLTNILFHKTSTGCTIVPIKKQNSISQLNENEYVLGFLPNKVKSTQVCPRKQTEIILQGTFLFTISECTLVVGNTTLKKLETHSSKVSIINGDFTFPELKPVHPMTIQEITDLDLNKTNQVELLRLRELEGLDYEPLFDRYELMGISLFISALILAAWFFERKCHTRIDSSPQQAPIQIQPIPVPIQQNVNPFSLAYYP
ncbi:hypothetical protein M8J77_019303 [Diaphorina citri]|nr:hypothetical protein M8J77_019303 [Diaphorina citri]